MNRDAICLLLLSTVGVAVGLAREAQGEVRIEKVVGMPDFGAEELYVVNRLGAVEIAGWDRPGIEVRARKRAERTELAEQLRVLVTRRSSRRLTVATFVRVRPALGAGARGRLHRLLQRQERLLGSLVVGRPSDDARAELSLIAQDFDQLRRSGPLSAVRAVDLSLPVESGQVDLLIKVPRHLLVRARTLSHDLSLRGCNAGATLSTERGAISVRDTNGAVHTFAPRGLQRFRRIGGDVTVEGGSGDVVLRQVHGGVRAVVGGGAIDAVGLRATTAELRTIGGAIRLSAPFSPKANYRLVSLRGDLIVSLPVRAAAQLEGRASSWDFGRFRPRRLTRSKQRVEASLGRGATQRHLQLSTGTGQVKLVALNPQPPAR